MKKLLALGALCAALTACGSASHATTQTITAHGYFGTSFAGNCGNLAGSQVIITDESSGKVLATVTISSEPVSTSISVSGVSVPTEEWQWTATLPVVQRYGVTIGGRTPFYASQQQMRSGLGLSC